MYLESSSGRKHLKRDGLELKEWMAEGVGGCKSCGWVSHQQPSDL